MASDTLFEDAEMIEAGIEVVKAASTVTERSSSCSGVSRKAGTSFTADSPYYTSYCEKEMRQVTILSETLKDISSRAKTFGKYGALMAESTRRLSSACRLEKQPTSSSDDEGDADAKQEKEERAMAERKESIGQDMSSVLELLAEVSHCVQYCYLHVLSVQPYIVRGRVGTRNRIPYVVSLPSTPF